MNSVILGIFIFIVVLVIAYFNTPGALNDVIDKWLKKTLWIWLPFFALYALTKELIVKSQAKK